MSIKLTEPVQAFNLNHIKTNTSMAYTMKDFGETLVTKWLKGATIVSFRTKLGMVYKLQPENRYMSYGLIAHGDPSASAVLDLTLDDKSKKWTVQSAMVLKRFIGKGYGTVLYETALADLGILQSSDDLSVGSSAVWQKLCTKYDGKVMVPTERGIRAVDIHGWTKDLKGHTMPIVLNKDGNPVDLAKLSGRGHLRGGDPEARAAKKFYYQIRK